jgi:hypothetical protein
MVELSKFVVEQIRICYASGLYHKADLAVRFSCHFENPLDILKVFNYEVFPKLREDLRMKIVGVGFINNIKDEYHNTVNRVAIEENESIFKDKSKASAMIDETVRNATKVLAGKLSFINKEFGTSFSVFDVKSRLN